MNGLKKPIVRQSVPTNYFSRQELRRIINATYKYDYGGGTDWQHRAARIRALILLMRWSGLAIKDAVTLEGKAMDEGGALLLRRAKTGVPQTRQRQLTNSVRHAWFPDVRQGISYRGIAIGDDLRDLIVNVTELEAIS